MMPMTTKDLEKKSAMYFNIIAAGAVINILAFLATTLFFFTKKEKLENSSLSETDPEVYAQTFTTLKISALLGYGVGFLAIIICAVFALKRLKITKRIQETESDLV